MKKVQLLSLFFVSLSSFAQKESNHYNQELGIFMPLEENLSIEDIHSLKNYSKIPEVQQNARGMKKAILTPVEDQLVDSLHT